MKLSIRKGIAFILCFTLLFSFSFQNSSLAKSKNNDEFTILVNNKDKIQIKVERDDIKAILKFDKETSEISLKTNEKSEKTGKNEREYKIDVETATNEKIEATFIDVETGEEFYVNSDELQASLAFLIPIGVVIGEALLAHLIAIGLALVISGVTYITYSEFINRRTTYNHYMALRESGALFIGNGLSRSAAITTLMSSNDTWSTSQTNAQSIAKEASPLLKAIGPEIDVNGIGKHYHYHPASWYVQGQYQRAPSHAFYGAPRL